MQTLSQAKSTVADGCLRASVSAHSAMTAALGSLATTAAHPRLRARKDGNRGAELMEVAFVIGIVLALAGLVAFVFRKQLLSYLDHASSSCEYDKQGNIVSGTDCPTSLPNS